jgi:murein L,D-transpeptidase YcbB/YkuD
LYKKCSACLVLIAFCGHFATAGDPSGDQTDSLFAPAPDAVQGPLLTYFAEPAKPCSDNLSTLELATPALLQAFYAELGYLPVWATPERRARLREALLQLTEDGLDPAHYQLPEAPADAHCADILHSRMYLQALQDLSRGKVEQAQVEPFWRAPDSINPDPRPSVLTLAWQGLADPRLAFAAARPTLPQYRLLREAYGRLRQQPMQVHANIPAGRVLKPGMQDARIPALRQRLAAEGYLAEPLQPSASVDHYDQVLADAVRSFQLRHGLQDDGLIGKDTLIALNTSAQARLDQLRVNLERWRWLAADIEQETLLVDIAGGLLLYYRDGLPVAQTRAQVGRPDRQTPRLKSLVKRLTVNPTWTVPPTILREDKLPKIRSDLGYLALNHMRVLDADGRELDPHTVDWNRPGNILLRQDAGPDNPLGKLVIRFPNPFSVYLHDTPSQSLFEKSPRTFSSGCVRVEGILELLEMILPPEQCRVVSRRLDGGLTEQIAVERRLPIVLAYWTANVDEDGLLTLRNDPYGLDAPLLRALSRPHN